MSTHDTTHAERFVDAYNRIEVVLRRDERSDGSRKGFTALVRESRRLIPRQRELLVACGDLRNTILHTRGSTTRAPIADPRLDIVEKLERQADLLENPPRVRTVLRLQPPGVFNASDDLAEFLEVIVRQNYSQVLIRNGAGVLELVTTNALARWFATGYEVAEGIAVESTTLAKVRSHAEREDSLMLERRDLTVVEAWNAFAGIRKGVTPAAIVLSANGKAGEKPLGLCVRSDLPAMLKSLA